MSSAESDKNIMNTLTRPMSYYQEKLALFTQRERGELGWAVGLHYSELQNTLIEINWVKLILSVAKPAPVPAPRPSHSEKFYLVITMFVQSHTTPHHTTADHTSN